MIVVVAVAVVDGRWLITQLWQRINNDQESEEDYSNTARWGGDKHRDMMSPVKAVPGPSYDEETKVCWPDSKHALLSCTLRFVEGGSIHRFGLWSCSPFRLCGLILLVWTGGRNLSVGCVAAA